MTSLRSTVPHRAPRAAALPALLWAAGLVAMVAATTGAAWPLALGWAAAGLLLALAWRALAPHPKARAAGCALLALVLVVLTWVGGLFLVPAALAGLVVSARQFDE
jgi:hypothetical protein